MHRRFDVRTECKLATTPRGPCLPVCGAVSFTGELALSDAGDRAGQAASSVGSADLLDACRRRATARFARSKLRPPRAIAFTASNGLTLALPLAGRRTT
jgi:hypothetical protein